MLDLHAVLIGEDDTEQDASVERQCQLVFTQVGCRFAHGIDDGDQEEQHNETDGSGSGAPD